MTLAEEDGEVTKATADEVIVKYKSGRSEKYQPTHFARSNEGSSINQVVVVKSGDKVKAGDPLVEGMSISGGELSPWQRPALCIHAMGRLQL
jgi:DNA-directed RNA polymerase subunit beta